MMIRMSGKGLSPFGTILFLMFLVFFVVGIFLFFGLMLRLLYFTGPVLLLVAVALDYKAVVGYLSALGRRIKHRPVEGFLVLGLNILLYPLVAVYLLGQILVRRRLSAYAREMRRGAEGELTDYEELDSRPIPPGRQLSNRNSGDFV
ncbi:MAG: hypothetical protein ACOYOO_13475 [Saprospiraceae bacterium]